MGLIIALIAIGWAWNRLRHDDRAAWLLKGAGATTFWLLFGLVLGLGSVSMLFVVLLPLGVVLLAFSARVEPHRAWLVAAGLVAVPSFFLASGAITAGGPVVWVAVVSGITLTTVAALAFDARARRFSASASQRPE